MHFTLQFVVQLPFAGTKLISTLEPGSKTDWHLWHGYDATTERVNMAISQFLEIAGSQAHHLYFTEQTGKEIFKTCKLVAQGHEVELSGGAQRLTLFS